MIKEKLSNEAQNTPLRKGVVTCWLDFSEEMPQPEQEIYVLDRYGVIAPTIHQGDWQKEYWVKNDYLWSARPACR